LHKHKGHKHKSHHSTCKSYRHREHIIPSDDDELWDAKMDVYRGGTSRGGVKGKAGGSGVSLSTLVELDNVKVAQESLQKFLGKFPSKREEVQQWIEKGEYKAEMSHIPDSTLYVVVEGALGVDHLSAVFIAG